MATPGRPAGSCGLLVTAEHKVNRFGTRYIYYHCTRRHRVPPCQEPSIEARELERQVVHFVRTTVPAPIVHEMAMRHLGRMKEHTVARDRESKRAARRAYDDTLRALANLRGLRVREMISEEEFVADYRKLDLERMRLAERLTEEPPSEFEPLRLLLSFSSRAVDWVSTGDDETKQLVVQAMSSNLRLRSKILSIEARRPFQRLANVATFPELRAVGQDVRTWQHEPWFTDMMAIIEQLFEKLKDEPRDRAA